MTDDSLFTTKQLDILSAENQTLLSDLIRIPSISKEEQKTAEVIASFCEKYSYSAQLIENNVLVQGKNFEASKPTILLASHHDTVKPTPSWSREPFNPIVENGKLYGLGSNDAGVCLVTLLQLFFTLDKKDVPFNVIFLAAAEEEISGKSGISVVLPQLPKINLGVIGEPTSMDIAVAEKGLMVVDCVATGKSGHAARQEGINAIDIAMDDIKFIHSFKEDNPSEALGPLKMTVTMINSGQKHNVIPDSCSFVIDIRSTDTFNNEAVLKLLKNNLRSKFKERSTRLQASSIGLENAFVRAAVKHGSKPYGSPTLSDQALIRDFPTVKISPGDSKRSHTADEYIYTSQLREGLEKFGRIFKTYIEDWRQ